MAAGLLAFLIVFDVGILHPGNYQWMMDGDATWHFLGWHFFRYGDWSWPLGVITTLDGSAKGGSIVYSDSIPLLAFPFKLLSRWLPREFQYFGLWTLLCYVLQGYFCWRIVELFIDRAWLRIPITIVLCLSPILLVYSRQGLGAHWLVLAGLYLFLRRETKHGTGYWATILTLAAFIHAYLLAMLLAIFVADLVQRLRCTENYRWAAALKSLAYAAAAVFISLWAAVYFVVGDQIVAYG